MAAFNYWLTKRSQKFEKNKKKKLASQSNFFMLVHEMRTKSIIPLSACAIALTSFAHSAQIIHLPFDTDALDVETNGGIQSATLYGTGAGITTTTGYAKIGAGALTLTNYNDRAEFAPINFGTAFTIAGW